MKKLLVFLFVYAIYTLLKQEVEIKKYENLDTHVIIKNISIGEKMTLEDVIKDRIKQEKTNVSKDADALRKHISQKIMQRKE